MRGHNPAPNSTEPWPFRQAAVPLLTAALLVKMTRPDTRRYPRTPTSHCPPTAWRENINQAALWMPVLKATPPSPLTSFQLIAPRVSLAHYTMSSLFRQVNILPLALNSSALTAYATWSDYQAIGVSFASNYQQLAVAGCQVSGRILYRFSCHCSQKLNSCRRHGQHPCSSHCQPLLFSRVACMLSRSYRRDVSFGDIGEYRHRGAKW